MSPAFFPALGALAVLAFDLIGRNSSSENEAHRANALSGIRLGTVAMFSLAAVLISAPLIFREIEVPTSASARDAMTRTTISSTRVKPFVDLGCIISYRPFARPVSRNHSQLLMSAFLPSPQKSDRRNCCQPRVPPQVHLLRRGRIIAV